MSSKKKSSEAATPSLPLQSMLRNHNPMAGTNDEQHLQHERRFAQIDKEVAGVKTDVGVLQADVRTLAAGQIQLQHSQDRGFREIKEAMQSKSEEPPKISMPMLVGLVSLLVTMGVVFVGAFWAAVMLLADPIKEDLREHKADRSTEDALKAGLANTDHKAVDYHNSQQSQIDRMRAELDRLNDHVIKDAEDRGRFTTALDWLRDDDRALKQELNQRVKGDGRNRTLAEPQSNH